MARLSGKMMSTLMAIRDKEDAGDQFVFLSGWPTYDALRNRGLITITARDRGGIRHNVALTDAGREAVGPKPKLVLPNSQ